jgi:hypothetical protein
MVLAAAARAPAAQTVVELTLLTRRGDKATSSVAPNRFRNWHASRADFSISACFDGSSAGASGASGARDAESQTSAGANAEPRRRAAQLKGGRRAARRRGAAAQGEGGGRGAQRGKEHTCLELSVDEVEVADHKEQCQCDQHNHD